MFRKSLFLSTGLMSILTVAACLQTANNSATANASSSIKKPAEAELTSLKRPGFHVEVVKERLWVLREGSEELADFKKNGEPAKSVTRPRAAPNGMSIRAVDAETIDAYLAKK